MIFVVSASLEAGGRAAYRETRDSVMAGDASALLAAVQDSTERQPPVTVGIATRTGAVF